MLIGGIVLALVGLVALLLGGLMVWLEYANVDSEGFYMTDPVQVAEDDSYAIVFPLSIVETEVVNEVKWADVGTLKLEAEANSEEGVFIALAEDEALQAYLEDVRYDEVYELIWEWKSRHYPIRLAWAPSSGSTEPGDPLQEDFWSADPVYGEGSQALKWELDGENRSIVVMNEDGSPGIDFNIKVGAERTSVLGLGVGTMVGGVIALVLGIFMIVVAVRRRRSSGDEASSAGDTLEAVESPS
jgi:hypothetical protein